MQFESPGWLILALVLGGLGWRFPELRLRRPLRWLALVVFVLILMRPLVRFHSGAVELWVLMDRSASAEGGMAKQGDEILTLLERSKPAGASLRVADFGAEVRERIGPPLELDASQTRLSQALRWVLGNRSVSKLTRFLLVSDGYTTEPLGELGEMLSRAGIPVDVRWLMENGDLDLELESLELPPRVTPNEAFLVQARVRCNRDGSFPFWIRRDGKLIGKGDVRVEKGRGNLRLTDRLQEPGNHRYEVTLYAEGDSRPENNGSEGWVLCEAGRTVLLMSEYENDPVGSQLQAAGFNVKQVRNAEQLSAGSLNGIRLVILNNVSADKLSQGFLKALPFYVTEQGGGLWMCGGQNSFGSGGYYSSPIDPLLPVSMDLREQQHQVALALAIVMDRSGSMGASIASPTGGITKMDLANEGAAQAIGLMSKGDAVAVYAVDTEAHEIVPLTELGGIRSPLIDSVRRVRSEGGGIYVYEGLKAGWNALSKQKYGARHIILFADANDSKKPDDYEKLLKEITEAGATVSVIGLGTAGDGDAALLRDIAARGQGRIFFQSDALGVPALFAQETMTVARPAFLKESAEVINRKGWRQITGGELAWLPRIEGYNFTLPRAGATVAAQLGGKDASPLVAFSQRGLGHVVAVTMPLAGPFSESARGWDGYATMLAGLARWSAAEEHPPGLSVDAQLHGTELEVQLYYTAEWNSLLAAGLPKLKLSGIGSEGSRDSHWKRIAPGQFQARVTLAPGEVVRGAVQIGNWALPFGPLASSSHAEWQRDPGAMAQVRALVTASGGKERVDLSGCWDKPEWVFKERPLQPWLLGVWIVLVVAEALQSRLRPARGGVE